MRHDLRALLRPCALGVAIAVVLLRALGAAWMMSRRDGGTSAAETSFPLDDAWIHLVYARSLTRGELFAYVDGTPEAGSSSPLWSMLLAPLVAAFSDPGSLAIAVKVLGVILAIVASLLAGALAHGLVREGRELAGALAALLVAIDPTFTAASVSGMEVPLASALALGAILAFSRERSLLAGGLAALALASRPELALLAPALACAEGIASQAALRSGERSAIARVAALVVPALIVGAAWSGFCLATTGRFLPNTFYVKHAAPSFLASIADGARALFALGRWTTMGAGLGALAWAALLLERDPKRSALALAFPCIWLAGLVWAHDLAHPAWFYQERYLVPVLPWLGALVGAGIVSLGVRAQRSEGLTRAAYAVLALAVTVAPLARLPSRASADATRHAWSCRNIEEAQEALARWLDEHTPEGAWIATNDAGAIRFLTDRPVLDMLGLNEHRAPGELSRLIEERDPRYVVIFPSWFPSLVRSPRWREVTRTESEHYVICSGCRQDVMVVLEPAP